MMAPASYKGQNRQENRASPGLEGKRKLRYNTELLMQREWVDGMD